MGKSMDIAT